MEISFCTPELQRICNSRRVSDRQWGPYNAGKIRQRLAELHAAETLSDVSTLPAIQRALTSVNGNGPLAVEITPQCRLVFEPVYQPLPQEAEARTDFARVTKVRILDVQTTPTMEREDKRAAYINI